MARPPQSLGQIADVDLRLLKVFRTVVDCGGFAAAALALGVGRSTISTHMSELETRLGMRLCKRGRGGFVLTAKGRQIHEETLKMLNSLEEFRARVNRIGGRVAGELRLGIVDNVIWDREFDWAAVFRRFAHEAPEVELMVQILSPDFIERQLLDGQLHVGILPPMHRLQGLLYVPLFEERSLLYCGHGHKLFGRADTRITDAEIGRCNYVRKAYSVSDLLGAANERFRSTAAAYHVEAIALLVLSGAYIGFLPEHYATHWVTNGEMRALRPDLYSTSTAFHALYRGGADLSPATELLLDALASQAGGDTTAGSAASVPAPRRRGACASEGERVRSKRSSASN